MNNSISISISILLLSISVGCGSDKDPPVTADAAALVDAAKVDIDASTSADAQAACGPTDLCTRSIEECAVELTLLQCESWYEDPTQNGCSDIDGYTTCNCRCIEEASCDLYFSCGTICFEDHC